MTRNILRALIRFIIRLIAKVEIEGVENLRQTGSFVFATNHLGAVDAFLVYLILDHWRFFIPVAEKWENYAFLRWLGKYLNFIFIDRYNPDVHALRKILKRMQEGDALVIAPEGTRSRTETMAEGKPGVSYLAAKSQFPIVPVALQGTEDRIIIHNLKRFKRSPIKVVIGKSFKVAPLPQKRKNEALAMYTDEIMCKIAVMLPEKYRGVYAEHPNLKKMLAELN